VSHWRPLLERVSAGILAEYDEFGSDLPAGAAESGWLGAKGASPAEIEQAEQRLGVTFPPGYRSFLEETNGFGPIGLFVRRLRPASEVQWLRDEDPELVRIWAEEADTRLGDTLVVSSVEDDARVLVNPHAVNAGIEWEACFFAHWVPGAEVFRSFDELIERQFEAAVRYLRAQRGEPTPQVPGDVRHHLDALGRPEVGQRVEALEALGNLRDASAAPVVAGLLRNADEDEWVRTTAARTLGQLPHPDSVEALVEILRLPYPQGRMFDANRRTDAQEAMIGLKHAAVQGLLAPPIRELAEPRVRAMLRDPDPELRAEARRILSVAHSWR
jgi:hypothetical protein